MIRMVCALVFARRRRSTGQRAGHLRPHPARRSGAAELADVLREPVRPALQPARRRSRRPTSGTWSCSGCSRRAAPAEANEKFEATPLVVDGVMYTVLRAERRRRARRRHRAHVLDLLRRRFRRWRASAAAASTAGVAILGDTLFMGTIDGHLIAIDAKTGKPIWDKAVVDPAPAIRSRSRRSSSRTRSSSGRRAASTASAASSPRSTPRPARRSGASTRFPGPASPGTRRGPTRRRRGRPAADRPG